MDQERLTGHWTEMERLIEGMGVAARGQGRCYGLCGPPGVGKTFLMRRAERTADGLGFSVLRGQAEAGAGPRTVFSALLPPTPSLPEEQVLSQTVERLAQISARAPVLLALEDLHLADMATVSILIHLARNAARLPVVVVLSYASDMIGASGGDVHPLMEGMRILAREGLYEEVRLGSMARPLLMMVVEEELEGPVDDPLADLIWERSEGNPMVAIEAVRLLVQAHQVEQRDGRWTAAGHVHVELPADYHAILRSRLDMLDAEEREILTAAAVAGRTFDPRVIAKLLGMDLLEVLERLDRVAREHKLLEDDGERYRFSAGGVRSVLLDDLRPSELMDAHNRIAKVMESSMMREAPFDDLSEHYYQAERADKCVCFSLLAGHRALGGGDPSGARAHFQKVLDATESGGFEEERLFSMEGMADAEMALGLISSALSRYEEVLRGSPLPNIRERIRLKMFGASPGTR